MISAVRFDWHHYVVNCWLTLCGTVWAQSLCAQDLAYRPEVGRSYDYGIGGEARHTGAKRDQLPIDKTKVISIADRWETLRKLATQLPRKWSDPSGSFSIDAKLVGRIADKVRLERVDNGQAITVSLRRLSPEDVDFTKTFGSIPAGS